MAQKTALTAGGGMARSRSAVRARSGGELKQKVFASEAQKGRAEREVSAAEAEIRVGVVRACPTSASTRRGYTAIS